MSEFDRLYSSTTVSPEAATDTQVATLLDMSDRLFGIVQACVPLQGWCSSFAGSRAVVALAVPDADERTGELTSHEFTLLKMQQRQYELGHMVRRSDRALAFSVVAEAGRALTLLSLKGESYDFMDLDMLVSERWGSEEHTLGSSQANDWIQNFALIFRSSTGRAEA